MWDTHAGHLWPLEGQLGKISAFFYANSSIHLRVTLITRDRLRSFANPAHGLLVVGIYPYFPIYLSLEAVDVSSLSYRRGDGLIKAALRALRALKSRFSWFLQMLNAREERKIRPSLIGRVDADCMRRWFKSDFHGNSRAWASIDHWWNSIPLARSVVPRELSSSVCRKMLRNMRRWTFDI